MRAGLATVAASKTVDEAQGVSGGVVVGVQGDRGAVAAGGMDSPAAFPGNPHCAFPLAAGSSGPGAVGGWAAVMNDSNSAAMRGYRHPPEAGWRGWRCQPATCNSESLYV